MMTIDNIRAAELIQGDDRQWLVHIAGASAVELYSLADELGAMLRHPCTQGWITWRGEATKRLGVIGREVEKREKAFWQHPSNQSLNGLLDAIWDACA